MSSLNPGEIPGLPSPPQVVAGFGFTIGQQDMRGVDAALSQSKSLVSNLRSMISNDLVNQLANAAVTSDVLKQQIVNHIQGALGNAAQAVVTLQQPITQKIVGQLGSSLERTIPIGVIPPTPDNTGVMPICTEIANGARNSQFDAAIHYYLLNGGDFGKPLQMQQIKAKQFIQQCLQGQPDKWFNLSLILDDIDNNPQLSNKYVGNYIAQPPTISTNVTGQIGVSPQSGVGVPPVTIGGAPPAQIVPQPGGQQCQLLPIYPGGPLSAAGCSSVLHISLDIHNPTIGPVNVCSALGALGDKATVDAIVGANLFAGYVNTPGKQVKPGGPPGISGGGGLVAVNISPFTVYPQGTGYLITYNDPYGFNQSLGGTAVCNPFTATIIPPTPEPLPCPPPTVIPSCPPPVINVTCPPPTTPPPQPKPPTEDKPCKFDLYCSSEGIVYAVKAGLPPHQTGDKMLASGDPAEWIINKDKIDQCWKDQQEQPQEGVGVDIPVFPTAVDGCGEFGAIPGVELPGGLGALSQLIGLRNADGTLWSPYPDGNGPPIASAVVNLVSTFIAQGLDSFTGVVNALVTQSGCATGQQLALTGTDIILKLWQQYIGGSLDFLTIPNDQQRHFLCPTVLPTESEAATAFLGNQIGRDTLMCWARANNRRWPEYATVVDAQRSKLSPQQMAFALRRGLIGNQTYADYIRESGYIRDFEAQLNYDLTAVVPPPSDIIRMMVRDAADNQLVQQFGLDDLFNNKFAGKLKDWAAYQGIDEQYMQYLWRSHWSIPAPGQLYQMLHRLSRLAPGSPAFVDEKTIRDALVQQDIAPFWIDKFLAISFNPLTRIDARRAYEIGALSQDELKEAYLNLGYSPDNADRLVEFNKRNITRTFLRRPEIKQLAAGEISNAEYEETMTLFGATDVIINKGVGYAALLRKKNTRTKCVKAIRKRFLGGDLSYAAAQDQLIGQGLLGDAIQDILAGWKCEMATTGKQLSASQAISIYADGIIDVAELVRRLQNVGYSYDDSVLLTRQINYKLQIRTAKDEITRQRQQNAEEERIRRQVEREANKTAQAQRRAVAAGQKMQKVKELREKRLIEAGLKYSENVGVSPPDGIVIVKALHNAILNNYNVTIDESIAAILLVSQDKKITSGEAFANAVQAAVQEIG